MLRIIVFAWTACCSVCLGQTPIARDDDPRVQYIRKLEEARSSLQAAAATLPLFETQDFVYNRWPHLAPSINESYRRTLSELIKADYGSEQLIQILNDPQARVRTLAMALLFQKEDPKLVRYVGRLDDNEQTFPTRLLTANLPDPVPTRPQTVADVAKTMTGAYMLAAGMKNWRDPGLDDLNEYFTTHRVRPYYFSWLEVRLGRATGLISPFQEDRRPALVKFREDLDKLPQFDHDLYLLWLCNGRFDFGGGYNAVLASEDELLEAARRLGHQTLLQIVDGRPPSTDPDIARNHRRYVGVVAFILEHADTLLIRADEPFLAAIEQGLKDQIARNDDNNSETLMTIETLGRARTLLLRSAPQ